MARESLYKAGYREPRAWKPEPAGSKAREESKRPSWGYLNPASKTYPVVVERDGEWYYSLTGAVAAYRRAILNNDRETAAKALRLINRLRREKDLEPWSG